MMQDLDRRGYLFSNKDLLYLILPLIGEQILAVMVGMADMIMVAQVGESAVSAISLVDSINILLINVFAAVATGGAVVCGQFLGKRQQKRACITADNLFLFTTAFAVLIMAFVYCFRHLLLWGIFGDIDPYVMQYCERYLMIVNASIPFIAIYNSGAALFRAMGNSKISMLTSLVMNGINVIGNAVLIYGLHMEVEGAAIPTLVSRIIAAAVIYLLIRNQDLILHVSKPVNLKPEFKLIKKILYIGVPNGIENSMFQLGKILVLSLVSAFGTASIAANAVSGTVATFQCLPGIAIGLAVLTVVSRCVGAGDYQQARYYTRKLMGITYGAMLVTNILVFAALPLILHMYNLSAETAQIAEKIMIYHGTCSILIWPLSFTFPNTLRAANDVRYSMVASILSMWIFRIGFSYVLAKYMQMGVFGVWIAMTIDWLARAVLFVVRYRGKKWEQHVI